MAWGLEQSMRILPSRSTLMNAKLGSITSFTMVRFRSCAAPMACQTGRLLPPSGSTPIRTPLARMTSRSITSGSCVT